jgi:hypothetical protein
MRENPHTRPAQPHRQRRRQPFLPSRQRRTATAAAQQANRIIDALGGTGAVAALFDPPIRDASVSGWRRAGIPATRLQTLRLLHPDVVQAATHPNEAQP